MALDKLAATIAEIGNIALAEQNQQRQIMQQLAFLERKEAGEQAAAEQDFANKIELQARQQDFETKLFLDKLQAEAERATIADRRERDIAQMKEMSEIFEKTQDMAGMKAIGDELKRILEGGGTFEQATLGAGVAGLRAGQEEGTELVKLGKPSQDRSTRIRQDEMTRLGVKSEFEAKEALRNFKNIAGDVKTTFDMFNQISPENLGPLAGRTLGQAAKFFRTDKNVVGYESFKEFITSNISRQLGGERGVLTDRDVQRVINLMPELSDSPESAAIRMRNVWGFIERRVKDKQEQAGLSSVGLSAFGIEIPEGVEEITSIQADEIISQKSSSQVPATQGGLTPDQILQMARERQKRMGR